MNVFHRRARKFTISNKDESNQMHETITVDEQGRIFGNSYNLIGHGNL